MLSNCWIYSIGLFFILFFYLTVAGDLLLLYCDARFKHLQQKKKIRQAPLYSPKKYVTWKYLMVNRSEQ